MRIAKMAVRSIAVLMLILGAGATFAQTWPARTVRIIATQPGGLTDVTARLLAQALSARLGHQFIVDNRTALVAVETAAKAPPDGYTVLVNGSALWLLPLLRGNVTWDPFRDFVPITNGVRSPSVLIVHPSLPVKSAAELIRLAKAKPGSLNYAAGTIGATPHLAAELFKYMAHVDMVRIGYKGTGPAVTAVIVGESQVSFPNAGSAMPHVKSGRLNGLAVCSAQPSALAPGLPTVAATGLPGFESVSPQAIFAPTGMSPELVKRINEEILRVMNAPEIKDRFFKTGLEVAGGTPEELGALMKAEVARMGKVIRTVGIREE